MAVDKDGNKIQIGSIIAARKMGRENFTQKGVIIAISEEYVTFRLYRNETIGYATSSNIKRIRYNTPKEK